MVDIRQDVCAVLVGGSPAPGINGVISAVVIKCLTLDIVPFGIFDGFKYLKRGLTKYYTTLRIEDVSRVHNRGGSILRTSKEQLVTDTDVENTIRALQHLRVKYLITIGGTDTAFSAHKLAEGFRNKSLLLQTNNININPFQINNNINKATDIDIDKTAPSKQTTSININTDYNNNLGGGTVLITHVPKTIFNDLPLPSNCYTFGFSTAREIGCKIVTDLAVDAKSFNRWYIVVTIGSKTGHLSLGIATASAATLCLIPEQFQNRSKRNTKKKYLAAARKKFGIIQSTKTLLNNGNKDFNKKHGITDDLIQSVVDQKNDIDNQNNKGGIDMKEYVDILDAAMIKRASQDKFYGVAVVGEGLVDLLTQNDLDKYFAGSTNKGHELFGIVLKDELVARWANRNYPMFIRSKFVGFELRSADPNAQDMILSRELGFSAVLTCQMKKVNATIVTMKGGELVSIPLSEIVDPDTLDLIIKNVDIKSLSYKVSQTYMIRLTRSDLQNPKNVKRYANICGVDNDTFVKTYLYVAYNPV